MNSCASLRDSLLLGVGSSAVVGGAIGNQISRDRGEGTIKGAVIGGVVGGIVSYFIHQFLEKRDANVRRETLMNLEHYEVLGLDGLNESRATEGRGKCSATREVDGRLVSIPCGLVNDSGEASSNDR